jgi:hypothetical protein
MSWRVAIVPDAMDGIALQIAHRTGEVTQQLIFDSGTLESVEPGTTMPRPSLRLDDALGRALLDALAEHYGHTFGGRQQRADFEHERRRVDKLTDRLLGMLDGGNWQVRADG